MKLFLGLVLVLGLIGCEPEPPAGPSQLTWREISLPEPAHGRRLYRAVDPMTGATIYYSHNAFADGVVGVTIMR